MKPPRREIARALASAFLAGAWERSGLLRRGSDSLAAGGQWLRHLVQDLLAAFPEAPRDARDSLSRFVSSHPAFHEAWEARWIDRTIRRRYVDGPRMRAPRWPVLKIDDLAELGTWLGLADGHLEWFADRRGFQRTTQEQRLWHYRYAWIPKRSGGARLLEAPKGRLKRAQRKLLDDILARIPVHPAAHGFQRGRSILTHASQHANREVVIRFDLRAFFADVHPARGFGIFRAAGYPEGVSRTLTALCTNRTPRAVLAMAKRPTRMEETWAMHHLRHRLSGPHLPQGAPTSPALANLCAYALDVRLSALAASVGARYSRYADDLTFSGDRLLSAMASRIERKVERIAAEEGFSLNRKKTRVMPASKRQLVTGLVVNRGPRIPRRAYDALKATLYNCVRFGPDSQRRGITAFRAHLEGRVAWTEQVNPARGAKLRRLFQAIDWTR
ncbi:MAG TPA: reverse transcriptase family protein [Myxococcaceae bacterium]|nr:reverse transcriptase family protein [Myxococcaceae bacterium]